MHKIYFAGIDGSGKSSCLDLLVTRLQAKFPIIKLDISDPSFYFKGERRSLVNYDLYKNIENLRELSIKYHFHSCFLIFKFIYRLILVKFIELFNRADIAIYSTDILLHPAVYFAYHFRFSRKIQSRLRFTLARCLFGRDKNISIFYLDTEPEIAMNRIQMRAASVHPHENTRDLTILKQEFDNMIEIALEYGFEIFRINTNGKNLEEITDEVQSIIEKKLCSRI